VISLKLMSLRISFLIDVNAKELSFFFSLWKITLTKCVLILKKAHPSSDTDTLGLYASICLKSQSVSSVSFEVNSEHMGPLASLSVRCVFEWRWCGFVLQFLSKSCHLL
jgi:hypothetical protein